MASSPPPSQGPTSGQNCYVTPAFYGYLTPTSSGVPKRGDKIKSGCITPAFPGVHKWAELIHNPCVFGGRQTRGHKEEWLHHPRLLGGPQVRRIATSHLRSIATSPLRSRGSPEEGTKSTVGASPLPSRGPTSGRNCYITPEFSGPQKRGQNHKWVHHPHLLGGPQMGRIAL